MPSNVERWWNKKRIEWYERASRSTSFHDEIANILSSIIKKDELVLELGCGLGYLAEKLYQRGYRINAYDIDPVAIARAQERTGLDIYKLKDFYHLDSNDRASTVIAMFFGRITDEENLSRMMKLADRRVLYIIGGGSARHTSKEEICRFLDEKKIVYSYSDTSIAFNQPFVDMDEAERFLSEYYSQGIQGKKRAMIEESKMIDFPLILKNMKEITIFNIEGGRK